MSIRAASRTAAEKLLGYLASECDADCVSRTADFSYTDLDQPQAQTGARLFPANSERARAVCARSEGGSRCQRRI